MTLEQQIQSEYDIVLEKLGKFSWNDISSKGNLDDEFIDRFIDYINIEALLLSQEVSDEIKLKYSDKFVKAIKNMEKNVRKKIEFMLQEFQEKVKELKI